MLNRSWKPEKDQDRDEAEDDEAARKLDTARSPFHNGVHLKADLLHARGGSRARYGTIKGKSFCRVRHAGPDLACAGCSPVHSWKWIPGNYHWLKKALDFYLSVYLWSTSLLALRMYEWRDEGQKQKGSSRGHGGYSRTVYAAAGVSKVCCDLATGNEKVCIGTLPLVLTAHNSIFAYSNTTVRIGTSLCGRHFIRACVFHRLGHCRDFQFIVETRCRTFDSLAFYKYGEMYIYFRHALSIRAISFPEFPPTPKSRFGDKCKFSNVKVLNFILYRIAVFNRKYKILKGFVIASANDRIMIAMRLYEGLLFSRENMGKPPISELFYFSGNQSNKQILLLHYCQ